MKFVAAAKADDPQPLARRCLLDIGAVGLLDSGPGPGIDFVAGEAVIKIDGNERRVEQGEADAVGFARRGNGRRIAGPRRRIIVLRLALRIRCHERRLSPLAFSLLPTPDDPVLDLTQRRERAGEFFEIGFDLVGLHHRRRSIRQ